MIRTYVQIGSGMSPVSQGSGDWVKYEEVKHLIDCALPEALRSGWLPMDTAPKDGTEFLAWRKDAGVMLVRWTAPVDFLSERELDTIEEDAAHAEGWFYADFVRGDRLEGDMIPTLWMPTPSFPSPQLPKEPTHAMLEAARMLDSFPDDANDAGRVAMLHEHARKIWQAMLAAANRG